MKRITVVAGDRYGALTVVRETTTGKKRRFLCRCDCGGKVKVRLDHLRSGHTESCGSCGVLWKGVRRTLGEWARTSGVKESTLRSRLRRGMDLGEAMER